MAALPPPPIVSFAELPSGWHQFAGGTGAYALSWPHRQDAVLGWGDSMPRNAIAVTVSFPNERARLPALKLVLPRRPTTTFEGTSDTPEYRLRGSIAGRDVEVWVDIRRAHPTRAQLRLAAHVVAALRFT
jgi:hypothetical protein